MSHQQFVKIIDKIRWRDVLNLYLLKSVLNRLKKFRGILEQGTNFRGI